MNRYAELLKAYADTHKAIYSQWYVGITDDPNRRLFEEHNVSTFGLYKHIKAHTEAAARDAEKALLGLKFSGGPGGGSGGDTQHVYIYKKTPTTRP